MAIHTFGEYLDFHPHLHALVADGLFARSGVFPLFGAHILGAGVPFSHKIFMNAQQQTEPWDWKKGESKVARRIGAQDFNEGSTKAQRRLDVVFQAVKTISVIDVLLLIVVAPWIAIMAVPVLPIITLLSVINLCRHLSVRAVWQHEDQPAKREAHAVGLILPVPAHPVRRDLPSLRREFALHMPRALRSQEMIANPETVKFRGQNAIGWSDERSNTNFHLPAPGCSQRSESPGLAPFAAFQRDDSGRSPQDFTVGLRLE
jgi:hypothetical protein